MVSSQRGQEHTGPSRPPSPRIDQLDQPPQGDTLTKITRRPGDAPVDGGRPSPIEGRPRGPSED